MGQLKAIEKWMELKNISCFVAFWIEHYNDRNCVYYFFQKQRNVDALCGKFRPPEIISLYMVQSRAFL